MDSLLHDVSQKFANGVHFDYFSQRSTIMKNEFQGKI